MVDTSNTSSDRDGRDLPPGRQPNAAAWRLGARRVALGDLIAEARSALAELAEIENSRAADPCGDGESGDSAVHDDQSTTALLDHYDALARRIIERTPETIDEIRALLMFCLEDRRYRLIDDQARTALIRSLLRSPALGGARARGAEDAGRPAVLARKNMAGEQAAEGRFYLVCAEGRPVSGALDYDAAARLACDLVDRRSDANISIYDCVAAIHYF